MKPGICSGKEGAEVTYALRMVAANASGVIATANAHFNHSVKLWTRDFRELGSVNDFLVSDQVQWQAPTDVEAGPSGDFYGLDPNRNRIVRVAPPGRLVTTYSLDQLGENLVGKGPQLRVWERGKRFFVLSSGVLRSVAFDGRILWSLPVRVSEPDGWRGGLDVDDEGRVSSSSKTPATRFRFTAARGGWPGTFACGWASARTGCPTCVSSGATYS